MDQNVVYVGIDVEDVHYHGSVHGRGAGFSLPSDIEGLGGAGFSSALPICPYFFQIPLIRSSSVLARPGWKPVTDALGVVAAPRSLRTLVDVAASAQLVEGHGVVDHAVLVARLVEVAVDQHAPVPRLRHHVLDVLPD